MEAIILAGGLGTRLKSAVGDLPKCLAPVNGKPFLYYLLKNLEENRFSHIVLALGFKHEMVEKWLQTFATRMKITVMTESEPLGTGGAAKLALGETAADDVFILNGDTYFDVFFSEILAFHKNAKSEATLALKKMYRFDRYGTVEMNTLGRIIRFNEKQFCADGLINGGIYILRKNIFDTFPDKFSMEKDYFEKCVSGKIISGFAADGYFIDIGVPEDYERAQTDFKNGKYKNV
ncbi:MAG: nucleotidyltransferase family protein [Prolixibacteraceae bacterium]|nr:nucleotidyltransferase family protein [Prolixibacteraceae bacterium]